MDMLTRKLENIHGKKIYAKKYVVMPLSRFKASCIAMVMAFTMLFLYMPGFAAEPAEPPEAVFYGMKNAVQISQNIDFTDMGNIGEDVREAIYESAALNLMEGYGNRQFGPGDIISKEQAIAIAYKIAGREANAVKAAEKLDSQRKPGDRKTDPVSMWADGYLQLAADDGLISTQDLDDAFGRQSANTSTQNQNAGNSGRTTFVRTDPAQRQEMAFWIAKTLGLQPVYNDQKLFKGYSDWTQSDPVKIPYLEAIVRNGIMAGNADGSFNPTGNITRGQAAVIAVNSESVSLPLMEYVKRTGTIEAKNETEDYTQGNRNVKTIFDVRNINGRLHRIVVEKPETLKETEYLENVVQGKDLVVYKDGKIGGSSFLEIGDRIEYTTAPDGTVKFVKVLSNTYDTKYMAAKVNNVDTANSLIDVIQLFKLDTPDIRQARDYISFNMEGEKVNAVYKYSYDTVVTNEGIKTSIDNIAPDAYVILTIKNGLVTGIDTFKLTYPKEETGVVRGIVEDNNPQLGYITLYNEDGTGTGSDALEELILMRTYSYSNPSRLEVFKNHERAAVEDVEAGDTVFLKLDDNGYIVSISAVDNYTIKYGRILAKRSGSIVIQFDNGLQQVFELNNAVPVLKDGKLTGIEELHDGDRVRLMLHITPKFSRIKEITLEGDEHLIAGIYKGIFMYVNTISNDIVLKNLEEFKNGEWIKTDRKGISSIKMSSNCSLYSKDKLASASTANRYLKDNEAYIAVEKDYGGNERAVKVSFRNQADTEDYPYNDTISYIEIGGGQFGLASRNLNLKVGDGTIIVKYGRLVTGSSIASSDPAYIVANRSYSDGGYLAGIVQIKNKPVNNYYQIYRGRIKNINAGKSFTLESFSELDGPIWQYANTPKTFNINANTRIYDSEGIVGQRDFIGYGDGSYVGQTVYVIARDTDAVLVSTAPYGNFSVNGKIFEITGGSIGDEGTVIEQPTGFKITNAKVYDLQKYLWKDSGDMSIDLLSNSVIIKGDKIIKPENLEQGDRVYVVKKDGASEGAGYIVIVED